MKLRALGSGSATCRHPLVPTSFLLQSEDSNTVFGCSAHTPAKLEAIGLSLPQIDIWAPLNARWDQIGGLYEVGQKALLGQIPRPYLVGPEALLGVIRKLFPYPLEAAFQITHSRTIHVNEEHVEETIEFVPGYLGREDSYGLVFDDAEIFISGDTELNDEWIHRHGSGAELILHACRLHTDTCDGYAQSPTLEELQTLPVYMQKKIWLYGYPNHYQAVEDPLPMIFLPQGQSLYDSDRKAKHLEKERFIRENSRRQLGNAEAESQVSRT